MSCFGDPHALCVIRLTDRQEAFAVRTRIDWKYVLLRRVARGDIPGATRKNEKGGS